MATLKLNRSFRFDTTFLDLEKRTIPIAVASRKEYLRVNGDQPYWEVLACGVENINTERLDIAPILWQHNTQELPRGKLDSYSIDGETLRGVARFARTPEGDQLLALVADGIVGQVSVGYTIEQMEHTGDIDGIPVLTATKWTPNEASFVTVAADPSVGVGRSESEVLTRAFNQVEQHKKNLNAVIEQPITEDIKEVATVTQEEVIQPVLEQVKEEQETSIQDVLPDTAQVVNDTNLELERITTLKSLGEVFNAEDLANKIIEAGKTVEDFKKELDAQKNITIIKKENKKMFNLNNALRGLYTGKLDEVTAELDAQTKEASKGFLGASHARGLSLTLPIASVLTRDYSVGTPAKGGDVVDKVIDGSQLIEALYAKNALGELGIQIWSMDTALSIPRQIVSGAVSYGYGETTPAVNHNENEFELIDFKPNRIAMYARATNQMLMQSSFDLAGLIRRQMLTKFGLEQQKTVFGVGGVNQPVGLDGNGIAAVTGASFATNARAKLIEMIVAISSKEGTPGKFFMNHATYWKFAQVKLDDGSGLFLARDGKIEGIEVVLSNAVANDTVYCGDWANVILTNFGALNIYLEPSYKTGIVDFVYEAFHDTNVQRPEMIVKAVFGA